MKKFLIAGVAAVALTGISLPAAADNWVLDFDTNPAGGADFASGTIFSNTGAFYNGSNNTFQRYLSPNTIPGSTASVRISAQYGTYSGDAYAVGYNSEGSSGRDPDLEDPFTVRTNLNFNSTATSRNGGLSATIPGADGGPAVSRLGTNVSNNGYGNVLIVQEMTSDAWGCGSTSGGICGRPDDSAVGGILKFDFSEAVDLVGMNIFDIEEGPLSSSSYMAKVWFYYEGGGSSFLDIPYIGDSSVAFMNFGAFGENVVSMRVKCKGSCAIDNITGDTGDTPPPPGVPEPGALALFGIGLAGMALARRRRWLAA